jgi:hypothetical protein
MTLFPPAWQAAQLPAKTWAPFSKSAANAAGAMAIMPAKNAAATFSRNFRVSMLDRSRDLNANPIFRILPRLLSVCFYLGVHVHLNLSSLGHAGRCESGGADLQISWICS